MYEHFVLLSSYRPRDGPIPKPRDSAKYLTDSIFFQN